MQFGTSDNTTTVTYNPKTDKVWTAAYSPPCYYCNHQYCNCGQGYRELIDYLKQEIKELKEQLVTKRVKQENVSKRKS